MLGAPLPLEWTAISPAEVQPEGLAGGECGDLELVTALTLQRPPGADHPLQLREGAFVAPALQAPARNLGARRQRPQIRNGYGGHPRAARIYQRDAVAP